MSRIHYALILLYFVHAGCGQVTVVTNPPISTTTKLVSSSLASNDALLNLRLKAKGLSTDCGGQPHCLTPSNVSGKIYYSGIMVGEQNGYSLGPIVGSVIDPSTETSFAQEDLLPFDLAEQLEVDGGIVCCEGSPYPADDEAIATRIESYFAHVDVTFTLSAEDGVAETLVGTHAIRTVYGDIDGTDMKKGDLLYKGAEDADYRWCTTDSGCTHTSRPDDPLQNEEVATFSGTPDLMGNQTIPTFAIQLSDEASQIALTEDNVLDNSWQFAIDFDMTNGVVFSQDITTLAEIHDLVAVFDLAADPGNTEGGFTAALSATTTPL